MYLLRKFPEQNFEKHFEQIHPKEFIKKIPFQKKSWGFFFSKTTFLKFLLQFWAQTCTMNALCTNLVTLPSILPCWEGIANDWLRKSLTEKSSKGHDGKWFYRMATSEFITFVCDKFLRIDTLHPRNSSTVGTFL